MGFWIQQQEKSRDAATAEAQRKVAEEAVKEEALQVYFDRISNLLVEKNLKAIAAKLKGLERKSIRALGTDTTTEQQELLHASVNVIRARTLSILRRFENDGKLKGIVIQFLIEAEIINKLKLDLSNADLIGADLHGDNLSGAFLSSANMSGADLSEANLSDADLSYANLSSPFLSSINMSGADLSNAFLNAADLIGANLSGANLSNVYLSDTVLSSANLSSANLSNAFLNGTDLSNANLSNANLSNANLSNTDLSNADLSEIQFNEKTIWPNPTEVAKAINIPEELKKQLGIPTEKLQEPDESSQS